jgi:PAS domain S-box-containing protein
MSTNLGQMEEEAKKPVQRVFFAVQGRLFLLLAIVLVPLLLIQGVMYYFRFQDERRHELRDNLKLAQVAAEAFNELIQDILRQELAIGLAFTTHQPLSTLDMQRILDKTKTEYPLLWHISWVNLEGDVIVSSYDRAKNVNVSDRPYFREILAGKEWAVSDILVSRTMGRPVFTVSRGIRDETGALLGVVVVVVVPEMLDEVMAVKKMGNVTLTLVDRQGAIAYGYPRENEAIIGTSALKGFPQAEKILQGEEVAFTAPGISGGKKKLYAFTPVRPLGWSMGVGRPEEAVIVPVVSSLVHNAGLYLLVALGSFLAALAISRTIAVPVQKLTEYADLLGRGEETPPITIRGPAELAELAHVFNLMAEEIRFREEWLDRERERAQGLAEEAKKRAEEAEQSKRILEAAQEELRRARDQLELKVRERTAELVSTNEFLEKEIGERKKAEKLLQAQNELLESLFSNIHIGVAYLDADFNFIRVNQAYADAGGHEPEFYIGKNHFDLYPYKDNKEIFQKTVETGEPFFALERPFEYVEFPERGVTYWDVALNPLKGPEGKVNALVLSILDVTERKKAQTALEKERERLFSLLDNLPAFVCLLDSAYFVRFANNYFEKRFGPAGDRSCYEIFLQRAEPCISCPALEVFKTGRSQEWEWTCGHDGAVYRTHAYPFTDVDGSPLVLELGIDITEHKRAEEELKRYTEILEMRNRELQDFAFVASHDLQEPLRKIQSFGDRLKTKHGEGLNEEARDYLERMQKAANRMQALIQALLAYSRVTTRAEPFVEVNLTTLVKEVLDDLETAIERTGGRVELKDLPVIEADPSQMRQLFQNLISNGLKFHGQEKPHIMIYSEPLRPERSQSKPMGEDRYSLIVEDNGIGFDEKYSERIFFPFQRLHGRDKYEGTGMGLAICRKIVERHGGIITAKSTPAKGSTFIITLPSRQPKEGHYRGKL